MFHNTTHRSLWSSHPYIKEGGQIRVPLMKSSTTCQKAHLPVALASLNNSHSSNLRACYASVKSSSRPSFVPARPLRPQSVAWRSLFVVNLSNIAPRCAPATEVEAHAVAGHCHVVVTTLACNLIWPYNSSVLNRCTNSFLILPSLASKPMRCKLSLCSSCLGVSTRVSTA